MKAALASVGPKKRWRALTNIADIRALIRAVDTAGAFPMSRCASRFLALTAQQPGMVHGAAWLEFEKIDWERPAKMCPDAVWRVPAAKMKLVADAGADPQNDHLVALAPAAVAVLHAIRPLTGSREMVFPSTKDADTPMSENTLSALYKRLGWKGRHVPHGWRASFSTVMNSRVERRHPGQTVSIGGRMIIDLMLAHLPTGIWGNELDYNRHGDMERRRELPIECADLILEGSVPTSALLKGRRRGSS